jgi:hypothetical protein
MEACIWTEPAADHHWTSTVDAPISNRSKIQRMWQSIMAILGGKACVTQLGLQ